MEIIHKPLVIIGPSGSGKSSLVHELERRQIARVEASWTDRPIRPNEEAIEHVFVDASTFTEKLEAGLFLDTVQPFGLEYRYGLPKLRFDDRLLTIVMLRYQFLSLFKKHYPSFITYHIEAPIETVTKALRSRGDQNIGSRLEDYAAECSEGQKIANRSFVNGTTLQALVEKVQNSIASDFPTNNT